MPKDTTKNNDTDTVASVELPRDDLVASDTDIKATDKAHAYCIDGVFTKKIQAVHADAYRAEGVAVYYADDATRTIDGVKTLTTEFFVPFDKYVKRSSDRQSASSKNKQTKDMLASLDTSQISKEELLALMLSRL